MTLDSIRNSCDVLFSFPPLGLKAPFSYQIIDDYDDNRWLCRPQRRGIALWLATLGNPPSPGDHDEDDDMITIPY